MLFWIWRWVIYVMLPVQRHMRRHRIGIESREEAHSPLDGRVRTGKGSIVVSPKWSFEKGTESNSFLGDLAGKESSCSAGDIGDMGLIPGLGRSPGGEHGNPLQYSCLENLMDRGAWWAMVHGVAKSWTQLKWLNMLIYVWCVELAQSRRGVGNEFLLDLSWEAGILCNAVGKSLIKPAG